jgi:hypothetical protein
MLSKNPSKTLGFFVGKKKTLYYLLKCWPPEMLKLVALFPPGIFLVVPQVMLAFPPFPWFS